MLALQRCENVGECSRPRHVAGNGPWQLDRIHIEPFVSNSAGSQGRNRSAVCAHDRRARNVGPRLQRICSSKAPRARPAAVESSAPTRRRQARNHGLQLARESVIDRWDSFRPTLGRALAEEGSSQPWHERGKEYQPPNDTALRQQRQEYPTTECATAITSSRPTRADFRGDHIRMTGRASVGLVYPRSTANASGTRRLSSGIKRCQRSGL